MAYRHSTLRQALRRFALSLLRLDITSPKVCIPHHSGPSSHAFRAPAYRVHRRTISVSGRAPASLGATLPIPILGDPSHHCLPHFDTIVRPLPIFVPPPSPSTPFRLRSAQGELPCHLFVAHVAIQILLSPLSSRHAPSR